MVKLEGVDNVDECDCIIGALINPRIAGVSAYRERADIARKEGIVLVSLVQSKENLERIRKGDLIKCRYWDGVSMIETETSIPRSFYDRTDMRSRRRNLAERILYSLSEKGVHFVNSPAFRLICADKWETYKILAEDGVQIPETSLYSEDSLKDFLDDDSINDLTFIKPRVASQGKGQFVISQTDKGEFEIMDDVNSILLNTSESVANYLRITDINDKYIIQRGIGTDMLEERVYDFRALFQRGRGGKIGMTAFYIRVAAPDSKQANIGKKGHPQDPYVIFDNYDEVESEVRSVGKTIIDSLSKAYVVGEVGLDFVFDKDYKLYALEVNSKPASKGFRTLREWVPTDEDYVNKNVIPYEYNNKIRRIWGRRLLSFLKKPLHYAKYLHDMKS